MKRLYNTNLIPVVLILVVVLPGCYQDMGNYDYEALPGQVIITADSYSTDYTKVLGQDTLRIEPVISYEGDEADLSYEWEIWQPSPVSDYVPIYEGKNLEYKCGPDDYITGPGSYDIRLTVSNAALTTDDKNPDANQTYSEIINLEVVMNNYVGLMVLHGDGTQSDVGLIEDDIFLAEASQTITTMVTPEFYSSNNQNQKISGVGRQVAKHGYVSTASSGSTFGSSDILILTENGEAMRTDYRTMEKMPADYKALILAPETAPGNPQFYHQRGLGGGSGLVDNGKVFYSAASDYFRGAMYSSDFDYLAAPYLCIVINRGLSGGTNMGVVAFDNLSKSFIYSEFNFSELLYKFPDSAVSGVNLEPSNMQADLIYMELSGHGGDARAVMEDDATGEKYLAVFDFYASEKTNISVGRYSMESLPNIDNAKYYAFGRGVNVSYYATSNEIYQYLYEGGNTANSKYTFPGGEEITTMEIIKHESNAEYTYYQYSNRMLVIGTKDAQNNGKVYAFIIDQVTGDLTLSETYDGTENGGIHFGEIYDFGYKSQ